MPAGPHHIHMPILRTDVVAARSIALSQHHQLAPPGLQQRFHHIQMPTDVEAAESPSLVSTSSRTPLSPHPHAHLRTDSEAVDSISILNPVSRFSRTPKMVTAAVLYAEGECVLYAEGERVRARVFVHPSSAGASAARARAADANMLTVNHSRVSSLPPSQAHGMVSPPPVNINVWSEVALRPKERIGCHDEGVVTCVALTP